MAIGDDFTIDFVNEKLYHSSGTTIYSVNEFYSWLQDQFDELTSIDDTIPMSAQTPIDYTLINGWFIDDNSVKFFKGASLQTSNWTNNIQVITLDGVYTNCVAGDIGKQVADDGTDIGVLLYYDNTLQKWYIRASTTIVDNSVMTITTGTGAGTNNQDSLTGETVWANPYTLGAIESETSLYVAQNDSVLTSWWDVGHVDILVKIKESDNLIDTGNIVIYGRQYSKEYTHFKIDLSEGGRQPVSLASSNDLSNQNGYIILTGSSGTGTFLVGEKFTNGGATAKGIITKVEGTIAAPILTYYLIGDLTNFVNTDSLTGDTSSATCTSNTPTNTGSATHTGITVAFSSTDQDLNNGLGSQPYSITIDCNSQSLEEVFERLKFITRRGETDTLNNIEGQLYRGSNLALDYDAQTSNFTEGDILTGGTSGATALIVAEHDNGTTGTLILMNVRGIFVDNEVLTEEHTGTATTNGTGRLITLISKSPFGILSGGKLLCASGVWLINIKASDAKNFQLLDDNGVVQVPPNTQNMTVQAVVSGDRVLLTQSTGTGSLTVKKDTFTLQQVHATGVGYIRISETIPTDTPTSGIIRVERPNLGSERYAYTSWNNTDQPTYSTFVLTGVTTEDYTTDSTSYVPYIDLEATATEEFIQIIYNSDRNLVTRVRKKGIIPFQIAGVLSNTGYTVSAIRTIDNIVT